MTLQLQKPVLDAGIVTRDIESASRFYADVLGLPLAGEIAMPGIGCIRRYAVGESTLRLFQPEQPPAAEGSRAGFASQTGIRYLTLAVGNLDEVIAAVRDAGYPVPVPPRELRPGVRVAQVEDGEGNTLELMQQSG